VSDEILTVLFGRWSDLAAQRTHLARGGLFVPAPDPLPRPYDELTVLVAAPDDQWVELRARVVQIAPGVGVALACDDPAALGRALAPLFDAAVAQTDAPDAAGTMVHWGRPAWTEPAEAVEPEPPLDASPEDVPVDAEPDGFASLEADGASDGAEAEPEPTAASATLLAQIRAMGSSEKLRLALHGDRAARLLLLKDPNKTIHLHILQNKRISLEEVQHIAGNRQANPEALARIGDTREWVQHPAVALALVSNPKTPSRTAQRLLRSLPQSEIRRIAKSPNVPQSIAIAARRLVVGGG
jgi:hypothetical protein